MATLFDHAFARLDHAEARHEEFGSAWAAYISRHPWGAELRVVSDQLFEIIVRCHEPAPASMSLAFSDWLAALRAALDNGLYAWAAAVTGQDPPPDAAKLQFPIATTPTEFRQQARRLASLPGDIVSNLEKAQPYQSRYGPESNLLYWLHELARVDRHRRLHLGLGQVAEHHVQVGVPAGVDVRFDEDVEPYAPIDAELVIARFTTSEAVDPADIEFNPAIGIDPEIKVWAPFRLGGQRQSLKIRMGMTQLFVRNHLENMAMFSGTMPPGGFRTFGLEQAAP
ncbi:hypothetical protein [Catellatospora sichuanensis]|uniref:hypothetical protein n=1 Tax=Catellatospora sichuanensis TaxID=1969805 RepID=UPI00118362C7|nr:hypothetical protein [Catellatospora sichuanensis]